MDIKKIIEQWQKKIIKTNIINRKLPNVDDFLKLGKIISVVWARRTWKTYLMLQIINQILKNGQIKFWEIIFLDFSEWNNHKIDLINLCQDYETRWIRPFFVLDEIQELPDFEKHLVYIYNQKYWCLISGSNAQMLSQDISTKLRWRSIEIYNDILSFEEYLNFKKNINSDIIHSQLFAFDDYINWGGYPEVVLTDTIDCKKSLLRSYFDVMIYRDLIDRYKIRNQEILNLLLNYIIKSASKPFNKNKFFNWLKSQWYSVSKNTI